MNERQKILVNEIELITDLYENSELEARNGKTAKEMVPNLISEKVMKYLEKKGESRRMTSTNSFKCVSKWEEMQ